MPDPKPTNPAGVPRATPGPLEIVQHAVDALDIGVRVAVLEIAEDVSAPRLHSGRNRIELRQLLRSILVPFTIGLLRVGRVAQLVEIAERFLGPIGLGQQWHPIEPFLENLPRTVVCLVVAH